eukprot:scaffold1704_cov100-Isochrysis_galbana.AAC.3
MARARSKRVAGGDARGWVAHACAWANQKRRGSSPRRLGDWVGVQAAGLAPGQPMPPTASAPKPNRVQCTLRASLSVSREARSL